MNETMLKTETTEKPKAELLRKLHGVSILSSLPEEQFTCFDTAEELHLAEGEHIARQGEVGRYFWMLLEGELRIYQTLPGHGGGGYGTWRAAVAIQHSVRCQRSDDQTQPFAAVE
jgi:hypothetical protein